MDNYTEAVVAFKEAMVLDPELGEKYSDIVEELEQMSKFDFSDDLWPRDLITSVHMHAEWPVHMLSG